MNIKDGNFITEDEVIEFKVWLLKNGLSLNRFAKKCGCSRQYLSHILERRKKVTEKVKNRFKLGGYEL